MTKKEELTEEEEKEIEHITKCMRKITLPELPPEHSLKNNNKTV